MNNWDLERSINLDQKLSFFGPKGTTFAHLEDPGMALSMGHPGFFLYIPIPEPRKKKKNLILSIVLVG